jgi:3-oxoacyl-[acyl-carrier protein] reductase
VITKIIEDFGSCDIVINNAGITKDMLMLRMAEEDWDTVLNSNLKSVFNVCRAVIRPMIKSRSGTIINMSSVSGLVGNVGQVNYSAAKAGILGLTKSLAKEVVSRNVRVNAIAPGFIDTGMLHALNREELMQHIPMGRFGAPDEVAQVALFLASEMSSYITGQVITVDGGMCNNF